VHACAHHTCRGAGGGLARERASEDHLQEAHISHIFFYFFIFIFFF
jgi:hypothetical protein